MNSSMIRYILGQVLKIEALFLLLPCFVAIIYHENAGFSFLITLAICGVLGIIMTSKKPSTYVFYLKEGCIATSLSWIFLSIFGCLPFVISGEIPSFTDALFETISGFTTTGASILSDIESLSYCSLFWRSFTHWIGGMGVLVFLLAVLPLTNGSNINLMRAESPGPSVGKLVPKVRYTARILYIIYLGMTLLEILILIAGGMPVFDAFTLSFGTAGTGGFGIRNDSIMSYSAFSQWVITIFMILFGVNFNAYYLLLFKHWRSALDMEEVKYYLIIIFAASCIIFVNIYTPGTSVPESFRHAAFQVASIITTTGYSTVDFDLWNSAAKTVLVILMVIGACAGSTGGGLKVSRVLIAVKNIFREMGAYIHPKYVKSIRMDNKSIDEDTVKSVNVYLITFSMILLISTFIVSFEGRDLETNLTAVIATLNNIGPGLAGVGPTQSFGSFSVLSKYVLMFDMLAGRLELFPLLLLFHPSILKDLLKKKSPTA
jgi:trk system potassium uptake protein TrkH